MVGLPCGRRPCCQDRGLLLVVLPTMRMAMATRVAIASKAPFRATPRKAERACVRACVCVRTTDSQSAVAAAARDACPRCLPAMPARPPSSAQPSPVAPSVAWPIVSVHTRAQVARAHGAVWLGGAGWGGALSGREGQRREKRERGGRQVGWGLPACLLCSSSSVRMDGYGRGARAKGGGEAMQGLDRTGHRTKHQPRRVE